VNKKVFGLFSSFVLISALLMGCGSETASNETKEEPKSADQKEVSNKEEKKDDIPEVKKDENGNSILETVGQKVKEDGVTAELLKIKAINETIDISPIKVTVEDIKLIKLTDLTDEEFRSGLEYMTEQKITEEGFTYFQVQYTAENTVDKNIEWYELMNVVTDKGEQIDAQMVDFISDADESDSVFYGKVKKEFTDGFYIKNADVSKIKLIFGESMDADSYDTITAQQQVEYSFE
jgi:hypothetical protein